MLYNYIHENNFRAFSAHENIFTTKKANYGMQYTYNYHTAQMKNW